VRDHGSLRIRWVHYYTGVHVMSRKDYKLIVKILNAQSQHMTLNAFMSLVEHFCKELKADNPNFDREKFMNALLVGD
jgi:hypothetical protein